MRGMGNRIPRREAFCVELCKLLLQREGPFLDPSLGGFCSDFSEPQVAPKLQPPNFFSGAQGKEEWNL